MRTALIGALALPLSMVPLFVYGTQTSEGGLIVDRARLLLDPPELPEYSTSELVGIHKESPHYRDGAMVLVYHGIGSGASGEGDYNLDPERFADHLATLRAAGMQPVTMQEVARALTGGGDLPDNAIAITFDDGRTDAMMFADPLLAQAGWRATMYVITGRVSDLSGTYYADWNELVGYAATGRWDLQVHTHELHHEDDTPVGPLPALTALRTGETFTEYRLRIRSDLEASIAAIEEHTGVRPRTFAYPFGAYGAERANDPHLEGIVAEEVSELFDLAVEQDDQDTLGLATGCSEPLHIHRLVVEDWTGRELLHEISGAVHRTGHTCPDP